MKQTKLFAIKVALLLVSASTGYSAISTMTGLTVVDTPNLRTLTTVTFSGVTYNASELKNGTSFTNAGTLGTPNLPNVDDGLILSSIHAGAGAGALPFQTLNFNGGNFTSLGNALRPVDFIIFEAGATDGDGISVVPVFVGGAVGTFPMPITGAQWGDVGLTIGGPVQTTQLIQGVAFSITDLFANDGSNLPIGTTLQGIAISVGGGVDLAGVYAVIPEPSSVLLGAFGVLGLLRRRRA